MNRMHEKLKIPGKLNAPKCVFCNAIQDVYCFFNPNIIIALFIDAYNAKLVEKLIFLLSAPGTEFVDEYIYERTFRILITSIFDNLSCKQHRTCCLGRGGRGGG